MIDSLTARYGTPGRFLWAAWDDTSDMVLDSIRMVVKNAERKLQTHLDAAGETY
jgi:hypothetical protein